MKQNKVHYWAIFIIFQIVSLLIIFACSTQSDEFETFHFNINRNLLSQAWTDSTTYFSFCHPKGWHSADSLTLHTIRSRMKNEYKLQNFKLVQLFSDSLNTDFCSVSRVDLRNEMSNADSIVQFFNQQITKKFDGSEINHAKIKIDDYQALQYRIITPDRVLFKLIFINTHPEIIQLDYAIARSTYQEIIESVESSIGSIHDSRKE
ncbi:hypothetical protein EH221_03555 [bacterium]|nr:MAG: hypothetical protein EH221_03555 [bacterium]